MSALLLVFLGAKGLSWAWEEEPLSLLWEQKQGSRGISHVESSATLFLKAHASLRDKLVLAPDSLHSAALREAAGQEIWGLRWCGSNMGLQRALCPCCWPHQCSFWATS